MIKTHETPECRCPACGAEFDSATGTTTDDAPKPGDFSVCLYCCAILVFNEDLTNRRMSIEEYVDLAAEEKTAIKNAINEIRASRL